VFFSAHGFDYFGASNSRFQRTGVFVSRCRRRRCWFYLTASAATCIFCRHLFVDFEFPIFLQAARYPVLDLSLKLVPRQYF
jgi:hypothetical protein